MNERQLCNLFSKSLRTNGVQYINIPDSAGSFELPFDGVINYKGNFVAFEAKRLTDYKSFNPKVLRDSQISSLNFTSKTGGTSIIGLFIWKPRTYNHLLFWEWNHFKQLTHNLTRSIKKPQILEHQNKTICTKKHFDTTPFTNYLDTLLI